MYTLVKACELIKQQANHVIDEETLVAHMLGARWITDRLSPTPKGQRFLNGSGKSLQLNNRGLADIIDMLT